MVTYVYRPQAAIDQNGQPVRAGSGQVFDPADTAFANPLTVKNTAGVSITSIDVSPLGLTDRFEIADKMHLVWKSGSSIVDIYSLEGMMDDVKASREAIETLRAEIDGIITNPGTGGGVNDAGIGVLVDTPTSATAQALARLYGPGIIVVDLDAPEVTEPEGAIVIRVGSGSAPEPVVYVSDAFDRSVASGWGTADIGGPWTVISTAKTSVSAGRARVQTVASETQGGMIQGFSADDTEVHAIVALDSPTAGARLARIQQRRQSSTVFHQVAVRQYGSAHASSPGRVDITWDESTYITGVLTGVGAGALVHIRSRVTGSSPTLRQVKVWLDGTPEPSSWTATTSTATGPQSGGGYAGIYFYSTGSEPGTAFHSVDLFDVVEAVA